MTVLTTVSLLSPLGDQQTVLYLQQKYGIDYSSVLELVLGVSGVSTSGGVVNN